MFFLGYDSDDQVRRQLEQEGVREPLPAAPLPIDDPEVRRKIHAVAGNESPLEFIARTGMSVSQIKALSVGEIKARLEARK